MAKEAIAAAGAIAASSTLAQALLQLGALQDKAGEFADSEASLERAIDTALANRDGRVAAAAWVRLVAVVGSGRGDAPRAHHLAARAQAAIAGIGGDDRLRATLATELAGVLTDEGRYPEALVEDLRALELSRAATGPESPDTLRALSNVAATLTMLERFDEALPKAREVLALTEKVFGPEHPQVAYCLNGLAAALAGRGEHEEAVKVYRRAIGLREKALGPDNPALVPLLGNLCQLLGGQLARFDEAVPMCERSIGIVERAKGADHVDAAIGHYMLGQVLRAQGQLPRAVEELERARATFEARFGADNPNLSDVLFELGQAHASLLHRPVAVKLLEQAVVLADKGSHASSRGDARWALARVLAPSDPQRARALAEAAKHDLASAAGKEAQQAEIEAFLGSMR
ncbi:MAG: tetratricopeptide repeat protein [Archangiaceae bacterium]|nr:tetratricopeptide repeat protein [Archangiaceae bacterium]